MFLRSGSHQTGCSGDYCFQILKSFDEWIKNTTSQIQQQNSVRSRSGKNTAGRTNGDIGQLCFAKPPRCVSGEPHICIPVHMCAIRQTHNTTPRCVPESTNTRTHQSANMHSDQQTSNKKAPISSHIYKKHTDKHSNAHQRPTNTQTNLQIWVLTPRVQEPTPRVRIGKTTTITGCSSHHLPSKHTHLQPPQCIR